MGDKTARKLILEFGTLEKLYEGLEKSKLTPRLKRVLGENRDQVFLSRDLFIIKQELDLDLDWDSMKTVLPTGAVVRQLLQTLGLRRILTQIDKLAGETQTDADKPDAESPSAKKSKPKKPKRK